MSSYESIDNSSAEPDPSPTTGTVLPGLPELPDDQSWATPVDPGSQVWKRLAGVLGIGLLGLASFSLGARLADDPGSSTAGLTGGAGGLGRAGRGQLGAALAGGGAGAAGNLGGLNAATAPTTFAPIVGVIDAVDPDIIVLTDATGTQHILAISDETVLSRTRATPSADLAPKQRVSVEPADADGLLAKTITACRPSGAAC
jgi:hypothetical protein